MTYKAGERTNGNAVTNGNARKIGSIIDYDPMSQETIYSNAKNVNSGAFRISNGERNSYLNGNGFANEYSNGSTVKIVDDGVNNNHESVVNKNYYSEPVVPRAPPTTVGLLFVVYFGLCYVLRFFVDCLSSYLRSRCQGR